jgi:hypothetical protein
MFQRLTISHPISSFPWKPEINNQQKWLPEALI